MTVLRAPRQITWLPWSREAFDRARAEHKPVLLSITTCWSDSCREMDRTSYADPAVAFLINERFVPVRVDADRRPDISERYNLGGWPTTAFLTPDGEMLGGGTFVEATRLRGVLEDVQGAFDRYRRSAPPPRAATHDEAAAGAPPPRPTLDSICARVFALFDEEHGGFGTAPKFPHTAPLHLALALHRAAPDARLERIVTRTLDAIGWGGLYDDAAGGFFRCAAHRDWTGAQREKLLDVNAALLRVYLEASQLLDVARYAERAADVLHYVQESLADAHDGGWHASEDAAGQVDAALFAESNAPCTSSRTPRCLPSRTPRWRPPRSPQRRRSTTAG